MEITIYNGSSSNFPNHRGDKIMARSVGTITTEYLLELASHSPSLVKSFLDPTAYNERVSEMDYNAMQRECKRRGLAAKGSADELRARLTLEV